MARPVSVLLAAALAPVFLVACGEDAGAPSAETSGGLDCGTLVPEAALTALGWGPGGPATEHVGRCERRVEGVGAVTVGTRALTGDPAATLTEECDALRAGGGYVAAPVPFLDPAREQSCLSGLADDTGTGVAELYYVNDADEVVQIRIEALDRVEADSLRAGLQELATSTAALA
jgi:hypothetical protein